MQAHIPSAVAMHIAYMPDRKLVCNKLGRDGTGKANLVRQRGQMVYGVLYALSPAALQVLDGFDAGYRRIKARVFISGQDPVCVQTYEAERLTDDPVPLDWYRAYIIAGAREHGLPADYVRYLEQLPAHRESTIKGEPLA